MTDEQPPSDLPPDERDDDPDDDDGTDDDDGDVGRGGLSVYLETQTDTLSVTGGLWENITNVDGITLDNPRFSPSEEEGEFDDESKHFRRGMTITNGSTEYLFIIGGDDDDGGLEYDVDDGEIEWDSKVTLYKYDGTSEPRELIEGASLDTDTLNNWRNGSSMELLDGQNYANGDDDDDDGDVPGDLQELRSFLDNSDEAEIYITDVRGRTDATLESSTTNN